MIFRTFIIGFVLLFATPASPITNPSAFREINSLLDFWDIEQSEKLLQVLQTQNSNNDNLALLESRLEFMRGYYEKAWSLAKNIKPRQTHWHHFKTLLKNTRKITKSFVMRESEHFQFYFIDGPDEILVHYASEVLEKSYSILGKIFNYYPKEKIRVEFYPSRETFSKISPLNIDDIITSGTVALCKYNRIMAISPASLYRGYNLMDTLSHEYVHYLLTRKSQNTVPLWLHEGLAKYFETRWRQSKETLTPIMETALARGLADKYLIGLDEMMPSFAKLKNAEDVQLAYAEVASMVDYMVTLKDETIFVKMIDYLAKGVKFEFALESLFGTSLAQFQNNWKISAHKKNYKEIPGLKTLKFRFKDSRKENKDKKETGSISSKKARDFTFLGDILKSRNHPDAAAIEYTKAINTNETLSPIIYNKLASTLMKVRKYTEAESLLHKSLNYYPMFHTTLINLGELYYQMDKMDKSTNYFERAIRLNPFNPFAHIRLIALYKLLNFKEEQEVQSRLFKLLE